MRRLWHQAHVQTTPPTPMGDVAEESERGLPTPLPPRPSPQCPPVPQAPPRASLELTQPRASLCTQGTASWGLFKAVTALMRASLKTRAPVPWGLSDEELGSSHEHDQASGLLYLEVRSSLTFSPPTGIPLIAYHSGGWVGKT